MSQSQHFHTQHEGLCRPSFGPTTLFLMVGLPGAGKTTRAKELAAKRHEGTFAARDERGVVELRVTMIFRRERNGWRVIHRHADPITPSDDRTETVIQAELTVSGAVYDVSGRPVTQAIVTFGKPAGLSIGKISGSSTYLLSVTLPVADLPGFAAVIQGPRPIGLYAVVYEFNRTISIFSVMSEGFSGTL